MRDRIHNEDGLYAVNSSGLRIGTAPDCRRACPATPSITTAADAIAGDTFNGTSTTAGYSIGDGANGFYFNPCTSQSAPFSPVEASMGPSNSFSNICYGTTDATGLPPSTCKS
jgi:hypothetical protein